MSSARWDRLAADLAAAGIAARVDGRPYSETRRGRAVHGVSRSITLRHPAGGLVTIGDQWWRKNLDVWIGWEVTREDADGITLGRPVRSKNRGDVVAAVRAALAR